ncbi:ABC transporter substrate-binding protein [Sulfurimonas sp. HSL-3221]|uniref:ABC transporter substrate-binding protein n=1 Tax=Sulfurimonadaceae TaxID=2771471 RepID=UPI001E58E06C|nr:ABC transporter substrate-binding protein [Sulfurimonas sp. HSL-3221]UFS62591.1 ABC transporter substrate-binding protein [Sulfurimonas sp. HSL-3221]
MKTVSNLAPLRPSGITRVMLLLLAACVTLWGRVVTDDFNRTVEVPETVRSVYATHPPLTMSLLAFDPRLVAALNFPFTDAQKPYAGAAAQRPVVGGFFGQGQTPNMELLLQVRPDVILMWGDMTGADRILAKLEKLGIPVLMVRNSTLGDLIGQFRLFGTLSGDTARAQTLMRYTKESLGLLEQYRTQLAAAKKVRYYFAEGLDGLSTECPGSFHIRPFDFARAQNALVCTMSSNYGMEKVSMESVMRADPDVIVAMEPQFVAHAQKDPLWRSLRAVKTGRLFLVPAHPYNYITRPPSFMRLMGIRWLMQQFYPGLLKEDEQARFEAIFFPHYKETDHAY